MTKRKEGSDKGGEPHSIQRPEREGTQAVIKGKQEEGCRLDSVHRPKMVNR